MCMGWHGAVHMNYILWPSHWLKLRWTIGHESQLDTQIYQTKKKKKFHHYFLQKIITILLILIDAYIKHVTA